MPRSQEHKEFDRHWNELKSWLETASITASAVRTTKAILVHDLSDKQFCSVFSLAGQFDDSEPKFVRHVALLANDEELPGETSVLHMGPPLESDITSPDKMTPDLVASLSLNERQKTLIMRWARRIETQKGPRDRRRYVICPHVHVERSERGQVLYHRFSCAGYAFEALKQAGVTLCDTDRLPSVGPIELSAIYPMLPRILDIPGKREFYGIRDDPDWPILLPAYLFHATESLATPAVIPTSKYRTYPVE